MIYKRVEFSKESPGIQELRVVVKEESLPNGRSGIRNT